MNIFEATKTYEDYINNHVNNVTKNYNNKFIPILQLEQLDSFIDLEELKYHIMRCGKQIYKHDLSKWSAEEFEPYRKNFYPTDEELKDKNFKKLNEKAYDNAWIHHYKNNGHHPLYWNNVNEARIDMPLVYIIEMLCDWFAMSDFFDSDCYEWWVNKADEERSAMTDKTIKIVDELFKILKTNNLY